jgi:signal transduction histidine kinase
LALSLRLTAGAANLHQVAKLAEGTAEELARVIAELRDLAQGIHPGVLTDAGLAAAVESLAERAPFPVDVDLPSGRFPPEVELTAYFAIAEALTNVAKHAGAVPVRVAGRRDGPDLLVEVSDGGPGGAAIGAAGSGLQGIADRADAIGGRLDLLSVPGQGTTLTVRLPVETPR